MKRLFILTGFALAAAATPITVGAQGAPDIGHGEGTFNDLCMSCHMKEGGGQGPTLVGVVGRASAAVPNVLYSKALQDAHLTFTPETLDKFLADPQGVVPGTAMPLSVPDAKDRADLIAYLASPANKP
jgi:cytochrome c